MMEKKPLLDRLNEKCEHIREQFPGLQDNSAIFAFNTANSIRNDVADTVNNFEKEILEYTRPDEHEVVKRLLHKHFGKVD